MTKAFRLALTALILLPGSLLAQNLVNKPDFGTTTSLAAAPGDFTTGLTLSTTSNGGNSPAGSYLITADATKTFNSGFTGSDHTTGGSPGVFMAVDGPASATTIVWQQKLTVQPGRTYTFSYWQRNFSTTNPASLQLKYQGSSATATTTAGSFQASGTTWTQTSYSITTGTGDTQLTLTLYDTVTPANGNDFALDDFALVQTNTGGIAGTVFEDINYGGGAGRTLATATSSASAGGFTAAIARPGAKVELYTSAGAYVSSTSTDGNGYYNFPAAAASTTYTVRVVSSSVLSARTGATTALLPVVTYAGGTTDQVGGPNPALPDAPANTTSATLASLTTASQAAEALVSVAVGTSGNATGTDFGFNFDLVVNTNGSGQGSLAQFILNSNALGNEAALAQAGGYLNQIVGASTVNTNLPAATETSIFLIPSGAVNGGLRAASNGGPASQLTNGVAVITLSSSGSGLAAVSGPSTVINGWTQSFNVGNTSNIALGTGGTVGVGSVVLPQLNGPEVQLTGSTSVPTGLSLTGAGTGVTGMAIYGFGNAVNSDTNADILVAAAKVTLLANVVGTSATSFAQPTGGSNADGIRVTSGTGLVVTNNLIGFHNGKGLVTKSGVTGATISLNEVRSNALTASTILAGIDVQGSASTISNNLAINQPGAGLDGLSSAGSNTWTGNTVTGNGVGTASVAPVITPGVRIYGAGNTITQNLIYNNYGAGVLLTSGVTNTVISQNNIYGNGSAASASGAAASGEIGIDLEASTDDANKGTSAYVTTNNSVTSGTNANGLQNFPTLTSAVISGTTLTVAGTLAASSTVELFLATPNAVSAPTLGNGYGQGSSFLSSTAISGTSFTITVSLTGLTASQRKALTTAGAKLTSTATVGGTGTSEFSGNVAVTSVPTANNVSNLKVATSASGATSTSAAALNPSLTAPQAASDPINSITSFTVFPASAGTLYYNGTAVTATAGVSVPVANTNLLTYLAPTTASNPTFSFTATSAGGTSNTATYTIPVVVSNAFVANDDGLDAPENAATSGNVILNDSNPNNTTNFTTSKVSDVSHGSLTLNADGSYTYTPTNGYTGADSFTYKVCTTGSTTDCSNTATVSINVYDPSTVCNSATGPNQLLNPGFELGNDGSFTSAYTYISPAANTKSGNTGLNPETTYAVDVNANTYHNGNAFTGLGRGGSGNFMIVNGAATQSKVYSQVINVVASRYYTFSGYAQSINSISPAVLGFVINGKSASTSTTISSTVGQYQQFSGVWFSNTSTTATFEVRDINRATNGNDFGLDDLYFGTCNASLQAVNIINSPRISYQAPPTNIAPLQGTTTSSGVSIASFVMQTVPTLGSLRLGGPNGTAIAAGQVITAAQSSALYYVSGGQGGNPSFTYTAVDNEGAGSSNVATYQIPVSAGPLPVSLVAFTAQAAGTTAQLTWQTASEVNNAYFAIERSTTGQATSFVAIGQLAGQGTVASPTAYRFTDRNAAAMSQLVYYRLRQVDTDGTSTYSAVRAVSFVAPASLQLSLYPNPTAGPGTTLDLSQLPATTTYQVYLLDATGRTARQWVLAGGQPQPLAVADLAAGTYLLQVTGLAADGSPLRQVLHLTKE